MNAITLKYLLSQEFQLFEKVILSFDQLKKAC